MLTEPEHFLKALTKTSGKYLVIYSLIIAHVQCDMEEIADEG